jgi:hypothetical protein
MSDKNPQPEALKNTYASQKKKFNNKITYYESRTTSTMLKHYHNHFSDMLLLPFGCMSFLSYSISQYSHHCEFCELILPFQKFQNGSTRSCRKTIRKTTRKSTSLAREENELMKQNNDEKNRRTLLAGSGTPTTCARSGNSFNISYNFSPSFFNLFFEWLW